MNRGEVWLINLDPAMGSEMKKTRPGVIVSNDLMGVLPLKIVVPLPEWKTSFSKAAWQIKIKKSAGNGLEKTSSADCFQVRSISDKRLVRKLGQLHRADTEKINNGLSICLALAAEFA